MTQLDPPMPRREVCRMLSGVLPLAYRRGRRGRPAGMYDQAEIMRRHAAWMRDRAERGLPIG